jgi:hypothetical protein
MRQSTIHQFLIRGTALGALVAMSVMAQAQGYSTGAPQGYGGSAYNRMPSQAGAAIQLLNDAGTGGDVHFLIDGQQGTLKAGQTLDLSGGPHQIEFNSGGNYGDLRFTLYQGLYKFKLMPEGWALFKSSSQPSSVAGRAPAMNSRTQVQRGYFTPPLPAEDLRTRRLAGRTNENPAGRTDGNPSTGGRPVNPPLPPSASTGAGQDTTKSIAAPPPPAPGVVRPRTNAPQTP